MRKITQSAINHAVQLLEASIVAAKSLRLQVLVLNGLLSIVLVVSAIGGETSLGHQALSIVLTTYAGLFAGRLLITNTQKAILYTLPLVLAFELFISYEIKAPIRMASSYVMVIAVYATLFPGATKKLFGKVSKLVRRDKRVYTADDYATAIVIEHFGGFDDIQGEGHIASYIKAVKKLAGCVIEDNKEDNPPTVGIFLFGVLDLLRDQKWFGKSWAEFVKWLSDGLNEGGLVIKSSVTPDHRKQQQTLTKPTEAAKPPSQPAPTVTVSPVPVPEKVEARIASTGSVTAKPDPTSGDPIEQIMVRCKTTTPRSQFINTYLVPFDKKDFGGPYGGPKKVAIKLLQLVGDKDVDPASFGSVLSASAKV